VLQITPIVPVEPIKSCRRRKLNGNETAPAHSPHSASPPCARCLSWTSDRSRFLMRRLMQPRLRRDGRDGIGGDFGSRTEVLHAMHDPLATPQSLSVSQNEPAPTPTLAGPNVAS